VDSHRGIDNRTGNIIQFHCSSPRSPRLRVS
jgi:hypothetical protein